MAQAFTVGKTLAEAMKEKGIENVYFDRCVQQGLWANTRVQTHHVAHIDTSLYTRTHTHTHTHLNTCTRRQSANHKYLYHGRVASLIDGVREGGIDL